MNRINLIQDTFDILQEGVYQEDEEVKIIGRLFKELIDVNKETIPFLENRTFTKLIEGKPARKIKEELLAYYIRAGYTRILNLNFELMVVLMEYCKNDRKLMTQFLSHINLVLNNTSKIFNDEKYVLNPANISCLYDFTISTNNCELSKILHKYQYLFNETENDKLDSIITMGELVNSYNHL